MSLLGRTVLGLIPARAGSKGVPGKNLRAIAGKPLVEYTLRAAVGSSHIDEAYLSSDGANILQVGQALGATLVRRPPEFATDDASAADVVRHFLGQLAPQMLERDPYIVYLQPTSPLRSAAHIDAALEALASDGARTLVSVCEMVKSPFKSFCIGDDGRLQSLFDERMSNARRQDLPTAYVPNGAIYVFGASDFRERGGFPSNGSLPFVMSESDSLDIDTEQDIQRLEHIVRSAHA